MPNDDTSLATFGTSSLPDLTQPSPSQTTPKPPIIAVATPNPPPVNDDITIGNSRTVETRLGMLETNLTHLSQSMESKLSQRISVFHTATQQRGGHMPGDANVQDGSHPTS